VEVQQSFNALEWQTTPQFLAAPMQLLLTPAMLAKRRVEKITYPHRAM